MREQTVTRLARRTLRGVFERARPGHGDFLGQAGFERIADLGKFLLPHSGELGGGKLLALAVPLLLAVGMFDGGSVFPMPLSIPVPAFAKRTLHRRAVVAVELAVAIPGPGALSRPLSGRAVLAMILAFFVAPFDRAVRQESHDGSGIAVVLHREIIAWMAVEPQ